MMDNYEGNDASNEDDSIQNDGDSGKNSPESSQTNTAQETNEKDVAENRASEKETAEDSEQRVPGSGRNDSHFADTYVLQRNAEYESNGYEYRTDSKGRIVEASGKLRLEESHRYNNHQIRAGGEDRIRETDHGGHLIGTRFGGSGKIDNIVAMDSKVNQSEFKKMEESWADELKKEPPNTVEVKIRPHYPGDSQRPDYFLVQSKITDNVTGEVSRTSKKISNNRTED